MASRSTIPVSTFAACAVTGLLSIAAFAQDVRVVGNDCTASIRVEAQDARLSDVLKRIARALDFQLSFESDADPLVTISASRDPIDALALVAATQNVSIAKSRNPRCPERERIVKVWILPKGAKVAASTITPPQPPQPSAAEQARAREGTNMILQAHGIPTPESEEDQEGGNPH